jgi:hypothetical protein
MRPVHQAETTHGRGDCFAACLASLLEISIEDVPNFRLAENPWASIQEWLGERGLCAIRCIADPRIFSTIPRQYCILSGASPTNPGGIHAVIALWDGLSAEVVHDPRPGGTGLSSQAQWVTFIGKLML